MGGATHSRSSTLTSSSTLEAQGGASNGGASTQWTATGGTTGLGGTSASTQVIVTGGTSATALAAVAGASSANTSCTNLDAGGNCGSAGATGLPPSHVLIVLDKSGSMNDTPKAYSRSKWESTKYSLSTLLASGTPSVDYGLLLYPYAASGTAAGCTVASGGGAINVPVGPTALVAPRIEQLLAATTPSGGTPTAAALKAASEYYTRGKGAALDGPKYVLLVTDGGPNCNTGITCSPDTCTANMDLFGSCGTGIANCCDPSLTVGTGDPANVLCLDDVEVRVQIQALRTSDVQTFVVGIPGSEVYASHLDEFAVAGGAPRVPSIEQPRRYYAVANPEELTNTLTRIATSLPGP